MLAKLVIILCKVPSTSPRQFLCKMVCCTLWAFFHIFLCAFLGFRLRQSPLTWLGLTILEGSNEQSITLSAH